MKLIIESRRNKIRYPLNNHQTGQVKKWLRFKLIAQFFALSFSYPTFAEVNLTCHDAKVFSNKLLTDICWSCLFPIKIAGMNLTGGQAPKGASDRAVCLCDDALGLPTPGLVASLWEPARLIELVRKPGCSPTLGGATLPLGQFRQQGTHGEGTYDVGDLAFYHYHYFAFPLLIMLDMFMDGHCNKEGYLSFDLMYASELDPTWQNDELAFFTQPEAASVAYPAAITACMSDAIAASNGDPIDALFWCAGSWGHLYPLSGHTLAMGSMAENTSHLAARAIAASHRRGLARRTMGNSALCGPVIDPMMIKSQYKMSMFYPVPESQSAHAIGQSTFSWGEWRTIPGAGEDAVYLIWRWQDCCNTVGG